MRRRRERGVVAKNAPVAHLQCGGVLSGARANRASTGAPAASRMIGLEHKEAAEHNDGCCRADQDRDEQDSQFVESAIHAEQ